MPSKDLDLDLTARCYKIRSTHVHSSQTSGAIKDLEDLLRSCAGHLFDESSVAPLKHIARCHGLPRAFSEPLRRALLDSSKDKPKFALQLALLLKYAQSKDPEFCTIEKLLQLLENHPPQKVAANKEFFELEIVTQILLTGPLANHADLESVRDKLEACKSYLPLVNAKFRTQIKGNFERMGFWKSSQATYMDFDLKADAPRDGEELIRIAHKKSGSKVSAHVVKTQQTQALTTEENVSEKTQMQNINLSKALEQGRAKCSSIVQEAFVSEAKKNKSGSDRSWWKTTSFEIEHFLLSARGKDVIKDNDIKYLCDKFCGFKFSFTRQCYEVVTTIAEIFALISAYQELETSTVIQLLKEILGSKRSDGHYDRARQDILTTTEYHCRRLRKNGYSIPEEFEKILSAFQQDSSCTVSMERKIWRILMNDKGDVSVNFEHAMKSLRDPRECLEALNYINEIVARDENRTQLESLGLISALVNIIVGSPKPEAEDVEGSASDEAIDNTDRPTVSESVEYTSDAFWDFMSAHKAIRSLREDRTLNISAFIPNRWTKSNMRSLIDRVCGTEHDQDNDVHAQNEDQKQAQMKALTLLEEHLSLTGSQGLDVDVLVKFFDASIAKGASSELSSPIIRCVLHTLMKNTENPPFFHHLPDNLVDFLFTTSCFNPDKKLQVFTLATLNNLMNNAEINQWILKGIRRINFLNDKLLRKDIIYHDNGRVILEQDLANDFEFGETETSSGGNRDFSCVSAIVARIFVATLQSDQNMCDEWTISVAIGALSTSPDKMTRIYCAEYLFGAAKYGKTFILPVLNNLQTILFDTVADVRIHACAAYCTALANLPQAPLDHISYLPKVYSFKTVLLGDEDLTPWINENVLRVIRSGAESYVYPENVFHLLTLVLNGTCADSEESEAYETVKLVLETIETYCMLPGRAETLPCVTIDAVENLLLESDVFDEQCARIIECCMMTNHWVSDAVIEEFAKYLVYSPKTSLPFLQRLCLANANQDLPSAIFESMQMQVIGLRLWPQAKAWPNGPEFLRMNKFAHANEKDLLLTLMDYLAMGKLLSPLNMSVLEYLLPTIPNLFDDLALRKEDEWNEIEKLVVKCLTMVGANGQGLSKELIELTFSTRIPSSLSFDFAIVLVRQSQQLPKHFLQQVFSMAENGTMETQATHLVMHMIMRNAQLPSAVLRGYCQSILRLFEMEAITMDLLSSLVKLVEGPRAGGVTMRLLKEAFLRAVETKDSGIAALGLKGLSLLDKDLIGPEDIQRISYTSQDPAMRAAIANFGANTKDDVWLPPDPKKAPDNLLQEIQSLIEQSRLRGLNLEFPEKWMRALKKLLCNDSAAAHLIEKIMNNSEMVHPIEIQIAEALCYGLFHAKTDNIKTHCKGALSAIIQRGADVEDLSKYLTVSNNDEDRKWELQLRGKEDKFLTDLETWQLKPEEKFAQARLSQHLQDKNVRQVYYKEVAEAAQKVNKIFWKDVPELVQSCTENLLRTEKAIAACAEVIEEHILLSTDMPSCTVLAAYMLAVKIGRVEHVWPVVDKCTKLLSPEAPPELTNATLQIFSQVSCRQQLPSGALGAVVNCTTSEEPRIRGRSFAILLQQKRHTTISRWNEIYDESLMHIYEEIFQSVDQDVDPKQDELNDALMLTVYSLQTLDLRRLEGVPREQWCEILMASDLIQTYGSSIDEQIMMQPYAIKVAKFLKPSAWLDFVQDFHQLRAQNPQVSIARLLALLTHALETANPDELTTIVNNLGFKQDYLTDLITSALSKLVESRISSISPSIAKMTVHQLRSVLLNVDHIYKLIFTVTGAIKLEDLEDLLNFTQVYGPLASDLESVLNEFENKCAGKPGEILQRLQLKLLMKYVPSAHAQFTNIKNHFRELLNSGFSYHQLHDLSELIKSNSDSVLTARINALESVLFQMSNYGACAEWLPVILKIMRACEDPSSWVHRCNTLTMERIFTGSQGMKTLGNILKELRELNPDMRDLYKDSMMHVVGKIGSIGDLKSSLCPELGEICCWNEDEIRTWASAVKGIQARNVGDEALCVAKRAFFLFKNYHLTDIQIFAIISSLAKSKTRGLLLQVSTGSGKSTIIAIIAVMRALLGTQVDIYTSSPVLAERDAQEWAKFYGMFGLTCSHNGDRGSGYVRGEKVCYKKDVVYGDTSQFQFDALRDEYSGLGTRGGRPYQYAIVDEVDSMFIDDSSKLARLSSTLPGMDQLQIIYHLMWNRLHDVQRRLFALGPRMFYLHGRIDKSEKDGLYSYYFLDENERIICIDNLADFVREKQPEDLQRINIFEIFGGIEEFVGNHLKDYIQVLIGDKTLVGEEANNNKIHLPKATLKYARTQVKNWVDSAMTALTFQENVHYIVDGGQIKPVDFLTTGVIQSSTNWNNGLHQFLQVKHALKVTTETVTTNFLSNAAMFKKYACSLTGLTGTLGSSYGTGVLKNIYKVETIIIPELYFKRFLRMRDKVCANHTEWLSTVLHSALHESSKSRGVLIICQTIKSSELVAEKLRKCSQSPTQIKMYVRNGENQEKQVERIHPGDIIVATNLAGRGTDIKNVEVERYGGLHVILTFLPNSLRVEEQAFGRTSRQGSRGSGQLIVNSAAQVEDLAVMRDAAERKELESFVQSRFKVIDTKDKLFELFCKTYQEIRAHLRKNPVHRAAVATTTSAKKWIFPGKTLTSLDLVVLRAVEELWAVFLKRIDDGDLSLEEALKAYEDFENEIQKDQFSPESYFERTGNCFYWIQFGNELYRRDSKSNDKSQEADHYFKLAIKNDPEFAAGAYAGRAFSILKRQYHTAPTKYYSRVLTYKEESMKPLMKALEIIHTEMALYTTAQIFLQNRTTDHIRSDLFNQLTSKIGLLADYGRNLSDVLSTVQKSLRAVECTGVSFGLQQTAHLPDQTKEVPFTSCQSYTLAMHDLSSRQDVAVIGTSVTRDQAIDTIDRAMQGDDKFSIGLGIYNQNLHTLAQVFSNNNADKGASLKLSGLRLSDIQALEPVRAKSFVLHFGGRVTKMKKLVAKLNLSKFQVSYEKSTDEMPIVYREIMSAEEYKNMPLPIKEAQEIKNEIIVSFDTFEGLKASANLLLPESSEIAITFNDIQFQEISRQWNTLQQINGNAIVVSNLEPKYAKKLITNLREKHLDFVLRLENLSRTLANFLLSHSPDRAQEEIVQKDLKTLNEQFSAEFIPLNEVRELALRGIELMAKFSELPFVPWRSVISIGILASAQVAAGGVLICTGLGTKLGMSLMTEGMNDYVTTWQTYSNRSFDLTSFWQQKAVSLAISCYHLGWDGLKDGLEAAKGVIAGSAVNEVTKKAGEKIVIGMSMNQIVQACGQKLNASLVVRQILVQGAETVARVGLNSMVDSFVQFSLDTVRKDLSEEIHKAVKQKFTERDFIEALQTYIAIDSIGQKQLSLKISSWVHDMTNQSTMWDTVVLPLFQGILSDTKFLCSTFVMASRILSTLRGMHEIMTAVNKVCHEIHLNICKENKSNNHAHLVYSYCNALHQRQCNICEQCATDIIAQMEFHPNQEFKVQKFPPQEFLDDHMVKLSDLKDLFDKLYSTKKEFKIEGNPEMSKIIQSVVDMLTKHLTRVANRQLASPWTTMAVGSLVAKISRQIQSNFIVSDAHMSMDQERMLELKKLKPDSLNDEQRAFLRLHDRPITTADQIRGLAKDHNVNYKMREMVARIHEMDVADSPSEKKPSARTQAAIASALKGGPADVITVLILAKINGKDIKIVDPNYKRTEDDIVQGVSIIMFQESRTPGGLGHYYTVDPQTGEISESSSERNLDCGYQVVADLTGRTVDELRIQAATFMESYVEIYEHVQESADWIYDRYPQEAGTLLMRGGYLKNKNRRSIELWAKKNGKKWYKSKYLKSVTHIYGSEEVTKPGTRPSNKSERKLQTQMFEEVIKREGADYEFTLKTSECKKGQPYKMGRTVTGHIGSMKNGQQGTDRNMICKSASCNTTYNYALERPTDDFIKELQKLAPGAYVETTTTVPEYGLLGFTDADGDYVEIPFAPELNVSVRLRNTDNPKALAVCDKYYGHLGPPKNGSYSFNITNGHRSVVTPASGKQINVDKQHLDLIEDWPSNTTNE